MRPWPLVLLALLQFLSPLGTVLFNAFALGVKPGYVLEWILQRPPLQVFETLLLMPIAGIAIYQMKRWSYVVFFAAMGWSLASNLRKLDYAASAFSPWMLALLYLVPVALVGYFMLPAVRRTYLDPSVRWWEAKPRYLLDLPIAVEASGSSFQARTQNISEGGVFFEMGGARLRNGQNLALSFELLSCPVQIPAVVMYSVERPGGAFAYGVRFLHQAESLKRFRRMIEGLRLIGVPHRDAAVAQPWYLGFREWAVGVLKSGRGLLPEIKSARK